MLSSAGFGLVETTGEGFGDRTRDAKGFEDSGFADAPAAGVVLSISIGDADAVSGGFSAAELSAVSEVLSSGDAFPGFCAPEEVAAAAAPFVAASLASVISPTPVFGFTGCCCAATGGAASEGITPPFSSDGLDPAVEFVEVDCVAVCEADEGHGYPAVRQ